MATSRLRAIVTGAWTVACVAVAAVTAASASEPPPDSGLHSSVAPDREAALARWHASFRERCLFPGDDGRTEATRWHDEIAELTVRVAREATVGAPLLRAARAAGVGICLDERNDGTFGAYDAALGLVVLGERLTPGERAVILVHELRHIDLAARGFAPSLDVDMRAAADVVCASEADVQAVATLFAWRLRAMGDPDAWTAAEGLDRYEDVALAFAATLRAGGDELEATAAAFAQWFASPWRTDTYRRGAYLTYLERCDATKAIPGDAELPSSWPATMCVLPDGRPYACTPPTSR